MTCLVRLVTVGLVLWLVLILSRGVMVLWLTCLDGRFVDDCAFVVRFVLDWPLLWIYGRCGDDVGVGVGVGCGGCGCG